MNYFKRLSIYALSNFLNKGISFCLLMIISHYLIPEEMGIYTLFTVCVAVVLPFIHLGTISGVQVEYFKMQKNDLMKYITSSLVYPFCSFVLILAVVVIFRDSLSSLTNIPSEWMFLIPVLAFVKVIPMLVSAVYRSMENVIKYSIYNNSLMVLCFLLTIFFVAVLGMKWEGRALGMLVSFLIFFVAGIAILKKNHLVGNSIKKEYQISALVFGVPLVPHLVSSVLIDASDRMFIANIVSIHDVGIYNMGYKFGALILLLQNTLFNVWNPFLYNRLSKNDTTSKNEIVKQAYICVLLIIGAVCVLTIISPFFFDYIIASEYKEGIQYVFWVALGYAFFAFYNMLSSFILYAKKTAVLSYISGINVVLNLVLNYYFIKHYGTIGAAYATAISFFSVFILAFVYIYKLSPMPWFSFRSIPKENIAV